MERRVSSSGSLASLPGASPTIGRPARPPPPPRRPKWGPRHRPYSLARPRPLGPPPNAVPRAPERKAGQKEAAAHAALDSALAPPPHAPVAVSVSGRDVCVDGVAGPLLAGLPLGVTARPGPGPGDLVLGFSAAGGAPTAIENVPLGRLARSPFLAGARAKLWWMTPVWGRRGAEVPPETQFLLVELSPGGPYAALTPLIDAGTFRGTLRPAR